MSRTVGVCECAERAARTVSVLQHVVTLGAFVDFRVELLLCARVAVLTVLGRLAPLRIRPLVSEFRARTWRRPAERNVLTETHYSTRTVDK